MVSSVYKKPMILDGVDISPDSYFSNSVRRPDDNFIVSRNAAGDPLSRYGDDVWDFSAYSSSHKLLPIIYFSIDTKKINKDLKLILFCFDRVHEKGMSGIITATTLRHYNYTLRKVGIYCESAGIEVADFFENPMHISSLIDQCSGGMVVNLHSIILMLRPLKRVTGIGLNINSQVENAFTEAFRAAEEQKQYPVIPSRILYSLIKIFTQRVEEYLAVSTEIDDFFQWLGHERSSRNGWLRGKVNEYSKETKSNVFQDYFLGISENLNI